MTKKELQAHDWKVGETVYLVGRKRYLVYDIPVKVVKAKIDSINESEKWCFFRATNEKDQDLLLFHGFCYRKYVRFYQSCKDVFLSKKEADYMFENYRTEFIQQHRDRLREDLMEGLRYFDRQKQRIWGIMRMKIMNKGNESSDS